MSDTVYEELLVQTTKASKLEAWLDSNTGGKRASMWETNLWALAMLAASALHFFMREIIKVRIDGLNASGEDAGAQAALDLIPPQPASAQDLQRAVFAFLETQRIDRNDAGRHGRKSEEPANGDARPEPDEPPAAVASALHQAQPERRLPVEVIALWAPSERVAVWGWTQHIAGGGQAPPPEVLTRTYLEDLRLGDAADRTTLLGWVGIGLDAAAVNWSDELWEEVLEWARAAHRLDRGEREVEVPTCPAIFLPSRHLFAEVKAFVHHAGETTRAAIVEAFGGEHPGVTIAVDALLAVGELRFGSEEEHPDDAGAMNHYSATEPGLRVEEAELSAAAEALGRRADVPGPRAEQAAHNYYGYRQLSGTLLGGSVDDDVALRFTVADRRPDQLVAVALLPAAEGFRGVIEWDRLTWTEVPDLVGHYRQVLVEELEDAQEQAVLEERQGIAGSEVPLDDDSGDISVGAEGEEPVKLGPRAVANIGRILGDDDGDDDGAAPAKPARRPRQRKGGA